MLILIQTVLIQTVYHRMPSNLKRLEALGPLTGVFYIATLFSIKDNRLINRIYVDIYGP